MSRTEKKKEADVAGQPNMQQLMAQAQKMQRDMAKAQAELADLEVTGTSGGGLVTATMTGDAQLKGLQIDPQVVDPEDVETLSDLVVAAVHAATDEVRKVSEQKLGPLAQGASALGAGFGL